MGLIVCLFLAQQSIGFSWRWVDDETWYLLPAKSLVDEGRLRIPVFADDEREFWPLPPLLSVLQAASWRLREMTAVQARLLMALFGAGGILATYAFGSRLIDQRVGLIAASLYAVDNMLFLAGRTVRPEIIVTSLTVAALWLLAKSVQEGKLWPVALSGIAVGASISTHPNGAVAAILGAVFLCMFQGINVVRRPQLYLLTLFSILAVMPMVVNFIIHDGARGYQSLSRLLDLHSGRATSLFENLWRSAQREYSERYVPFLVFPYRLHVGLLAVAAVVWGLLSRKRSMIFLALCVVVFLLFFWSVAKANKSPRYMTNIMPFVILLWAYWAERLWSHCPDWSGAPQRLLGSFKFLVLAGLIGLVGLVPLAGNAAYLWKHRHTDINATCQQIDRIVPPQSTIYGGMAFWIGLKHHTYVPYMRMPWSQAVAEYQPTIVILDDWVMVHGSYPGEWDHLRKELHEYVGRHGRLLGTVKNRFYGDLQIYQILSEDEQSGESPSAGLEVPSDRTARTLPAAR